MVNDYKKNKSFKDIIKDNLPVNEVISKNMNLFYNTFKKYKSENENKTKNKSESEKNDKGFISKFQMSKYFKPTEKAEPIFYNIKATLTEIYNKERDL